MEISRSRGGATLGDSVCARLGADPDDVFWDSYRTPEGRWIVSAAYGGSVVGSWLFESVGRTVHPQDESARALMGGGPSVVAGQEETTSVHVPSSSQPDDAAEAQTVRPRLVSVTSDPVVADAPLPRPVSSDDQVGAVDAVDEQPTLLGTEGSAPRRAKRAKGKKGRASVPSWDEILFGASRPED